MLTGGERRDQLGKTRQRIGVNAADVGHDVGQRRTAHARANRCHARLVDGIADAADEPHRRVAERLNLGDQALRGDALAVQMSGAILEEIDHAPSVGTGPDGFGLRGLTAEEIQRRVSTSTETGTVLGTGDGIARVYGLQVQPGLFEIGDPDLEAAATAYSKAAAVANAAGFHLTELQALTRSVALRRKTGVAPDGSDELAELYGSFTEGFEEHDLLAAKQLLDARVASAAEGVDQ